MKHSILAVCVLAVLVTISLRLLNGRHTSQQTDEPTVNAASASAGAMRSETREDEGSLVNAENGVVNVQVTPTKTTMIESGSVTEQNNISERTTILLAANSPLSTSGEDEELEELHGSQTKQVPTSARALPPEHLAALIVAAVGAEIIEETDGQEPVLLDSRGTAAPKQDFVHLQERVSAATDADKHQVGFDLIIAFQTATSDEEKVDLLAMAAELKWTSYTTLLLRLGLATTENEEVRVQAVFVAGDLSPSLLNGFVNDINVTIRDEIKAQLAIP